MSRQLKNGTWLIPANQVEEFLTKKIDYDKLIADCMKSPQAIGKKKKKPVSYNTRPQNKEVVIGEFEIDLENPDHVASEKKKGFWNQDVRVLFKK